MPQFVRDVEEIRQQRSAAGRGAEVQPAHEPGTRGRAPRKGREEIEQEEGEIRAGGEGGSSRSVHVTNPIRKRKKAA